MIYRPIQCRLVVELHLGIGGPGGGSMILVQYRLIRIAVEPSYAEISLTQSAVQQHQIHYHLHSAAAAEHLDVLR